MAIEKQEPDVSSGKWAQRLGQGVLPVPTSMRLQGCCPNLKSEGAQPNYYESQ